MFKFIPKNMNLSLLNKLQIKAFQKVSSKFLFVRGLNISLFFSINSNNLTFKIVSEGAVFIAFKINVSWIQNVAFKNIIFVKILR